MKLNSVRRVPAAPRRRNNPTNIRASLLIMACAFSFSCATTEKPKVEAPPAAVVHAEQPQQMPALPPPEAKAVQEAVTRVFKDSAVIDTSRTPNFVAGDFNGDLSQDIAVVLKPAPEKLSSLNGDFTTWILRDISAADDSRVPRLRVAANEVLLAVIHGYGSQGWHDAQATQTYLLKHAVGSGLKTHQPKTVAIENQGKQLPQLHGDVIGEVIGGKPGYLYHAGATYSWYDPRTFKGEPEPVPFHMRPSKKIKS